VFVTVPEVARVWPVATRIASLVKRPADRHVSVTVTTDRWRLVNHNLVRNATTVIRKTTPTSQCRGSHQLPESPSQCGHHGVEEQAGSSGSKRIFRRLGRSQARRRGKNRAQLVFLLSFFRVEQLGDAHDRSPMKSVELLSH